MDCSSPEVREHIEAVEKVLSELNAIDIPKIMALNKMDKVEGSYLKALKENYLNTEQYLEVIEISAKEGANLEKLLELVSIHLPEKLVKANFLIPYSDSSTAAYLHRNSNIIQEEYREDGIYIEAMIDEEVKNKTMKYII